MTDSKYLIIVTKSCFIVLSPPQNKCFQVKHRKLGQNEVRDDCRRPVTGWILLRRKAWREKFSRQEKRIQTKTMNEIAGMSGVFEEVEVSKGRN